MAHGQTAKAMQAYISKIDDDGPEEMALQIHRHDGSHQMITIATDDGTEEQTVYEMSDGTFQAVTDASEVGGEGGVVSELCCYFLVA